MTVWSHSTPLLGNAEQGHGQQMTVIELRTALEEKVRSGSYNGPASGIVCGLFWLLLVQPVVYFGG